MIILKPIRYIIILLILLLTACTFTQEKPAPIVDLRNQQALQQGYYVVSRGETLYFIAWRLGKDYRDLANINQLAPPYPLKAGEKIYLQAKVQHYRPSQKPEKPKPIARKGKPSYKAPSYLPVRHWLSPASGTVIKGYSEFNKGINIAGKLGEAIRSTAAGEVVYAGSGLRGYGKLLLIKHNDIYLSAYAHNKVLLVHEGQFVKAGQMIAEMGSTGANRVMLHFELRKRGKPVNPLRYVKIV